MNKKLVLFWYTLFLLTAIISLHASMLIGPSFRIATWFILGLMTAATGTMGIILGRERQKEKKIAEKRTLSLLRILESDSLNDVQLAPRVKALEKALKTTPWTRRLADSFLVNYAAIPS